MEKKLEEIAELLRTFHYSKAEGAVLTYLMSQEQGTAHEIEKMFDLCPPEISLAITRLRRGKRIRVLRQEQLGSYKPTNVYGLKDTSDELLSHIGKWQDAHFLSRMNLIANTKRILKFERQQFI